MSGNEATIVPVILSGGSGTRLWPLSRTLYPKQLQPIVTNRSMLQETALRAADPARYAPAMVICNAEHRFAVAEQLREINLEASAIVLEPVGRNTAPAAALGALLAAHQAPDTLILLLSSDHVITRPDLFHDAVETACKAARAGRLVTFGITPQGPETAYGYIRAGNPLPAAPGVCSVEHFVEKPDLETAKRYLAEGGYTWNSGMFLFRADSFLDELERLEPDILAQCRAALDQAEHDLDFLRPDAEAFAAQRSVSIDYAVMERTDKAAVVPCDPGWTDIGSWTALWALEAKDASGNASRGDVLLIDTSDSLVRAESRLVTTVGMVDVIVVETPDAVLVLNKSHAQQVKLAVEALKAEGRTEADAHAKVYRPWGDYQDLDRGAGFLVKRITVVPGGRLSLQRHTHRAEHWVVISGTARVTRGPDIDNLDVVDLTADQSIDIPLGWVHRLENPGTEPCAIIEVQSGSYLSEDDIERLEDSYGRA